MKSRLLACLILWVLAAPLLAQGVFVCVQPNGTREYRNTGDIRGCRRLDTETISTIPAPTTNQQAKAGTMDSSFPRIDSQIQKRRDQDRLQILMDEVRTEESKLSELRREYQNGEPERLGSERNYAKYQERVAQMKDDILRTEKNIEALKREIGNLK
jgi:predicted RNase H-like nuclease (RuvC/YqgF family)